MHKLSALKDKVYLDPIGVFILCSVLFVSYVSSPLWGRSQPDNQKFIHYSARMGLSSSAQSNIVQDKEGFIWIGTLDGLNRFDGYSFKVYRKISHDITSLQSNAISTLFVDKRGNLWVGTYRGGLSLYNKDQDKFIHYDLEPNDTSSLSKDVVTSIAEDSQGQIWVSTFDGLSCINLKTGKQLKYYFKQGQNNNLSIAFYQVRTLTIDGNYLWIGYYSGTLSRFDLVKKTFTHYKLFDDENRNVREIMVTSICVDGDLLWISTWNKGIWIFNKKTGISTPFEKINYPFVNFIFKDNKNQLWIATESNGLILIDAKRSAIIEYHQNDLDKYSISNNSLSHVFQDRQGNIWIASKKGDLNYLVMDNPFRVWRRSPDSKQGLNENNVTSIVEDDKRQLWIGYLNGGIDVFDSNQSLKKISFRPKQTIGLGEGTIVTIFKSRNGTIWAGTFLDGLKRYDPASKTFISFRHNPKDSSTISSNSIRQIAEDSQGNLWIATHGGGLEKYNPKTGAFTHHRVNYQKGANSISSDWLYCVMCDKEDNIWVGSVAGLSVMNKSEKWIKQYKNDPANDKSLSNDNVNTLLQDSKMNVWIGTSDGLNKLDRKTGAIKVYSLKEGLPNNIIAGILEDDGHNLWISTSKGLSMMSSNQEIFKNYFIEDGLETDEFRISACFKNTKGEMYFGGFEGLNRFHPDSLKIHPFTPPVYITDFKLFNQPVLIKHEATANTFTLERQLRFSREITLDYDQNIIGFEFIALDYRNLHKIQYSYIMEGFDKNWSKPGNKREVTYTNLHPGGYVFRVKATNSDGIWNEQSVSIRIIIEPPFWKTNWAIMLYILLFSLLLYGFWELGLHHAKIIRKLELEELEIKKLQEMDVQKMRFFANISHEFRTPLALIVGPLENLRKSTLSETQQTQVGMIHRNTQRLLRLINQLMDFRKLAEGLKLEVARYDIIKFINVVSNYFVLEARERNIKFEVITNETSVIAWFDRDKIEKVLFNLIGNAFKFTPEKGRIIIRVTLENLSRYKQQTIKIVVEDSGIGIPKDSLSKIFDRFYQVDPSLNYGNGIGLALAKELIQLHKGELKVESELGIGSQFTVLIPLQIENVESVPTSEIVDEENAFVACDDETEIDELEKTLQTAGPSTKPLLHIIEDNIDMRLYIRSEFTDSYHVIDSFDAVSGLEKAIAQIPDIILCDVMMPGENGIELCKKLKNDERTSHIPLILLTARSSEENILEGLECGADDYISKPFSSSILKVKIKNLVESRRSLQKRFMKEPQATISEISPTNVDEKFLSKAYEIVEQNLDNSSFEANDFATAIGMSRAQLYRKIQAMSGQSVKEFVRIIRLKKAAEMLIQGDHNISEVAFKVGFSSVAYFTKSFGEYFGVTPSNYISSHRGISIK